MTTETQQWLVIENPKVAPVEAFTVLGYSTSNGSDTEGVIGKFGSGNKHGANFCLRNNVELRVFCGVVPIE